jgi:hypothetical protein
MGYVAALTPGVAIDGRYDVSRFVLDDAGERPSVPKASGLAIELIDLIVEKRVELCLGFAARLDDERVHSWHLID